MQFQNNITIFVNISELQGAVEGILKSFTG